MDLKTVENVEVNEICVKKEAKPPYELTYHANKNNKTYKSAYGDQYPRTVFVKKCDKLKKSESFAKKIKHFFYKPKHQVHNGDSITETTKFVKNVESVSFRYQNRHFDNDQNENNRYIINSFTKEKQRLYLVNNFAYFIL